MLNTNLVSASSASVILKDLEVALKSLNNMESLGCIICHLDHLSIAAYKAVKDQITVGILKKKKHGKTEYQWKILNFHTGILPKSKRPLRKNRLTISIVYLVCKHNS